MFKLLNNLESFIYTKNRIDLYNKESIGLNIALKNEDIEDDRTRDDKTKNKESIDGDNDYLVKNYRGDGYSLTSKTRTADDYLKNQDRLTINR